MNLRPRYSLLTLLVVTALVAAGGVKLWYGPHHVVERPNANDEVEYSYTRDWKNNKTIDGPHVTRSNLNQKYPSLDFTYYRQGMWVNWNYTCLPVDDEEWQHPGMLQADSPLQPQEWLEFHRVIELEKQRVYPPGIKLRVFEGPMNLFTF